MSYQLTAGGGEGIFVRDKGSANAVQGFNSAETTQGSNVTALPTVFLFQAFDGFVSFSRTLGTVVWIKVAGTWKTAVSWIKVAGVWKQATPYIKDSGTWK